MSIIQGLKDARDKINEALALYEKNELLKVTEAAEVAGMPRDTFYHYVKIGKIPAEKRGKQWFVRSQIAQNVHQYLEGTPYAHHGK